MEIDLAVIPMFSKIKSITKSMEAKFVNYKEIVTDWICPENSSIVEIRHGKSISKSSSFPLKRKLSKRGRKPKEKKESKSISRTSFQLYRTIHRTPVIDEFAKTSTTCTEHQDCEIIYKTYNMLMFNGGHLVCVGITDPQCEDFYWCIGEVTKFLTARGMKEEDLGITAVNITLENFKFALRDPESRLDLIRINNFFAEKKASGQVINVRITDVQNFIVDCIENEKFDFDPEVVLSTFNHSHEIIHYFIAKSDFFDFLKSIDLREWSKTIQSFHDDISHRFTNLLTKTLDNRLLKTITLLFVKRMIARTLEKCNNFDHWVVDSFSVLTDKNTAIMSKRHAGITTTIKVFISGKVDILGAKNRKRIEYVPIFLQKVLSEGENLCYHIDKWK